MKFSSQLTNRTYILIVIALAILFIGGLLTYQNLFKFPEEWGIKIIGKKENKDISVAIQNKALNIPAGWWFPGGDAPPSYIIFRKDGTLEIPSWFFRSEESAKLAEYYYDVDNNLLRISFKMLPDLFPENKELATDFLSSYSHDQRYQLVEYDKQNLMVGLKVNSETDAIEFLGWIFYRVNE